MESIGNQLKKAREDKGISLEKAQNDTRIHTRVLAALEEDRAPETLSPVYVKGFLKRYAQYLGLESESMVGDYLSTAPPPPKQVLRIDDEQDSRQRARLILTLKIVLILVLTLAFIVYIRFTVQHAFRSRIKGRQAAPKVAPPVQAKMFPIPEDQPLKLTISAKEDSWIQIKSDEKLIFQNVLSKGSVERWDAGQKLELWVGNAAALQFDLNGRDLGSPGRGVIKDILITREGMKVKKR